MDFTFAVPCEFLLTKIDKYKRLRMGLMEKLGSCLVRRIGSKGPTLTRNVHRKGTTTTSTQELEHFSNLASSWWNVDGPQRILHKMNLLRMDFISSVIRERLKLDNSTNEQERVYVPAYSLDLLPTAIKERIVEEQERKRDDILMKDGFSVLDVGCGGGILAESLARLGFVKNVKGIDLSQDVLKAAEIHRDQDPLFSSSNKLSYELKALEDIPEHEKYDIITMFEMLEHVDYPSEIMNEAMKRVKKGGWIFLSTINRDFVSWFTTIFMGEYILGIVPIGTHSFDKYIKQSELSDWVTNESSLKDYFEMVDIKGCMYLPFVGWQYSCDRNTGNYFMALRRIK